MKSRRLPWSVALILSLAACANSQLPPDSASQSTSAPSSAVDGSSPAPNAWPDGLTPPGSTLQIGEWATYAERYKEPKDVARVRVADVKPEPSKGSGTSSEGGTRWFLALIEWERVRGEPDPPTDAQAQLGLDWVRRSASLESGQRVADERSSDQCFPSMQPTTSGRSSCVRVPIFQPPLMADATLSFNFRLTLGDVEGPQPHIYWSSPLWAETESLDVPDICASSAFLALAPDVLGTHPKVDFCDGQWALIHSARSAEGEAPSLVVRRTTSGSWTLYTGFPTAKCAEQFRADGGPDQIAALKNFPPCT